MKKFIQKIKSVFVRRKRYVYFIDGEKFTTNNYDDIPLFDISSPNENIPAFENLESGYKFWCKRGFFRQRLTGPAIIWSHGTKQFYLDDIYYQNIRDWINDHPNPELYFNAIGIKTETDKILWFLQN
jgi:hypothetical protein